MGQDKDKGDHSTDFYHRQNRPDSGKTNLIYC